MNVVTDARCTDCGRTIVLTRLFLAQDDRGSGDFREVYHYRRADPEEGRTSGIVRCGPVIVVGDGEGALTLVRGVQGRELRRLRAERRIGRIYDTIRALPVRRSGDPAWLFGPEGIDYRAEVRTFQDALLSRAETLAQGNARIASGLLGLKHENYRKLKQRRRSQRLAVRRMEVG